MALKTSSSNIFLDLFFRPNANISGWPSEDGLAFEEVSFPSRSGQTLHGFFLKPHTAPRGTLIQCHGNAGNITCHFELMNFVVNAGYQVLSFDYSGYWKSEGKPNPEGLIQDTLGALDYVRSRGDVNPQHIGLFGQSLGGAAAMGAMARDPDLRCLVLEATFTTYRDMAWATGLGKLLFFIVPFVIPDIGPKTDLPKLGNRPLLIVHGTADGLVPVRFSHELFEAASGQKTLKIIEGYHHLNGEPHLEEIYQKAVLAFLEKNLAF